MSWSASLLAAAPVEYNYSVEYSSGSISPIVWIIYIAVLVLMFAGMWKAFLKAGKPGWAAIVPIYNIIVLLQIANKPIWWVVLFLIPIVSLVMLIIVMIEVAKQFGKGGGFGVGLALLGFIFWPILGFGSAQHRPA